MMIEIDGQLYEQTGNTLDGKPVVCKDGDFERACKSFRNDLLYAVVEGCLVPLDEHKKAPAAPAD